MISRLWNPIQEYIDSINSNMPAVHHYTSLNGGMGILRSGRLWFTERTHLNDPTEIRHGIDIAERVLRTQARSRDAARLRAASSRVFNDLRFFSASFSLAYDDAVQWRKYADNRKGVSLSFKAAVFDRPKEFIDQFIAGGPTAFVCPMSYESERLQSVITSIINFWDGNNIDELADHVFMISSMFKGECWVQEKEYRFFIHHPYSKISQDPYCKTRQPNIAYLDLPIQGWRSVDDDLPVYRICLGPASLPMAGGTLAAFLRKLGIWPREGILKSGIP